MFQYSQEMLERLPWLRYIQRKGRVVGGKRRKGWKGAPDLQVHCLHCGGAFDALDMWGRYLERRCPQCGEVLRESDYDQRAVQLSDQRRAALERWGSCEQVVRERKAKLKSLSWWRCISRAVWKRRAAQAENDLQAASTHVSQIKEQIQQLALDRYGIGEWFQLTHMPLQVCDKNGAVECQLDVRYTSAGRFMLTGNNEVGGGIVGEFTVFEALRARVQDERSNLYGAALLPNLYLPFGTRSGARLQEAGFSQMNGQLRPDEQSSQAARMGGQSSKNMRQVDCVVATDKCAFVIEVKKWRAHVQANAPFSHVHVARGDVQEAQFSDASDMLRQVREGAKAFERASSYATNRIFRVIVFVNPLSFESDASGFCNRMLVGAYEPCRVNAPGAAAAPGGENVPGVVAAPPASTFVGALEEKLEELDAIMTDGQHCALGNRVLEQFGDLDGTRRLQASERREQAVRYVAANPAPSQGTRAVSARKHSRRKRSAGAKGRARSRRRDALSEIDLSEWDWWFEERFIAG